MPKVLDAEAAGREAAGAKVDAAREHGHGLVLDGPGRLPEDADAGYRELVRRLSLLSRKGTRLGLSRIAQVLADLRHPELGRPAVHVAGSNGKGSTSAFLAAILSAAGRRVGLYTSPHLVSLTERIQIVVDCVGREVDRALLVRAAREVEVVAPGFGDLTFFEVITAAGFIALGELGSEIDVIEAGLGARLDATRLMCADVGVLTDLSLEHTDYLGDSIESIAAEEGAVMRPGRPLVCADGPMEAMVVIDSMARSLGVPVYRIGEQIACTRKADGSYRMDLGDRVLDDVKLALLGPHQGRNAVLACKAALLLEPSITEGNLRRGLEEAKWPGRMEIFSPTARCPARVLLDGAHNAQGAEALSEALLVERARFEGPLHFVFAVMSDKDAASMLRHLVPLASSFIVTALPSSRCAVPEDVVELIDPRDRSRAEVVKSARDALNLAAQRASADGGWVVVAGSLYLVGEVRPWLAV